MKQLLCLLLAGSISLILVSEVVYAQSARISITLSQQELDQWLAASTSLYPDTLLNKIFMDDQLAWTQKLGDVSQEQQGAVMNTTPSTDSAIHQPIEQIHPLLPTESANIIQLHAEHMIAPSSKAKGVLTNE